MLCLRINVLTDLFIHTVNTILCSMHCDIAGTRTFAYRYTEKNACTVYIVACSEHYVVAHRRGFIIVCTLNYNIYIYISSYMHSTNLKFGIEYCNY